MWYHIDNNTLQESIGGEIRDSDGKTICLVMGKGLGKEKATANAKLISAAPDLLEALIELRKLVAYHDLADAAINKALGGEK